MKIINQPAVDLFFLQMLLDILDSSLPIHRAPLPNDINTGLKQMLQQRARLGMVLLEYLEEMESNLDRRYAQAPREYGPSSLDLQADMPPAILSQRKDRFPPLLKSSLLEFEFFHRGR